MPSIRAEFYDSFREVFRTVGKKRRLRVYPVASVDVLASAFESEVLKKQAREAYRPGICVYLHFLRLTFGFNWVSPPIEYGVRLGFWDWDSRPRSWQRTVHGCWQPEFTLAFTLFDRPWGIDLSCQWRLSLSLGWWRIYWEIAYPSPVIEARS